MQHSFVWTHVTKIQLSALSGDLAMWGKSSTTDEILEKVLISTVALIEHLLCVTHLTHANGMVV